MGKRLIIHPDDNIESPIWGIESLSCPKPEWTRNIEINIIIENRFISYRYIMLTFIFLSLSTLKEAFENEGLFEIPMD